MIHINTAIGVVIAVKSGLEVTRVLVVIPAVDRVDSIEPQYHNAAT